MPYIKRDSGPATDKLVYVAGPKGDKGDNGTPGDPGPSSQLTSTNITVSSSNVTISDPNIFLSNLINLDTTTSDKNILGIESDTVVGSMFPTKQVHNNSNFNFNFINQSSGASTKDRVITPDGNTFVLTSGSSATFIYDYIDQRWRKIPDPPTIINSILNSQLVNRVGIVGGETVHTAGGDASGDGRGSGLFTFSPGDVTTGTPGMKYVVPGYGSWKRKVQTRGYVDACWTNVKADGTTNDDAAVADAIAEAISSGVRRVHLPAGTIIVNKITNLTSNFCFLGAGPGVTYIRSLNPTSGGITQDGVIDISGSSLIWLTMGDFTIDGNASVDPRNPPAINSQRHGIYTHLNSFMQNCVFKRITMQYLSGCGMRDAANSAGSFQNTFEDLITYVTGNHGLWFYSLGTGSSIKGGSCNAVPENCAGVRTDAGNFAAYSWNGLSNNFNPPSPLPGGYWPVGTSCFSLGAEARAVFLGCNFEDYGRCGIDAEGPAAPFYLSCTWRTSAPWPTRLGDYYYIDGRGQSLFGPENRFFSGGSGLGNPKVLQTDPASSPDNAAWRTTQAGSQFPHFATHDLYGFQKVFNVASGTVYDVPTFLQAGNYGGGSLGLEVSHLRTKSLKVRMTYVTTTGSAISGREEIDCTAGNITRTMPLATQTDGSVYRFVKVDATVNTATIQRSGGDSFVRNGAAVTSIVLSSQGQGIELWPTAFPNVWNYTVY